MTEREAKPWLVVLFLYSLASLSLARAPVILRLSIHPSCGRAAAATGRPPLPSGLASPASASYSMRVRVRVSVSVRVRARVRVKVRVS